jgi:hypothetical protein
VTDPLSPAPGSISRVLESATIDQLRDEVRRRGLEIHSKAFSLAAQQAIRELEGLRKRVDELINSVRAANVSEEKEG